MHTSQHGHFLNLLHADVRLAVYAHCDAVQLARLEQTCRQVRDEIQAPFGRPGLSPWRATAAAYARGSSQAEVAAAQLYDPSEGKLMHQHLTCARRSAAYLYHQQLQALLEVAPTCFGVHPFATLP